MHQTICHLTETKSCYSWCRITSYCRGLKIFVTRSAQWDRRSLQSLQSENKLSEIGIQLITLREVGWTQVSVITNPFFRDRLLNTSPRAARALSPSAPAPPALRRGTKASSRAPQKVAPSTSRARTICSAFSTGAAGASNKSHQNSTLSNCFKS